MLAWLHSAAVGEQEALEVLFVSQEETGKSLISNLEEGFKSELWVGDEEAEPANIDIAASLRLLVEKNLETVAKPMRVRSRDAFPDSCTY